MSVYELSAMEIYDAYSGQYRAAELVERGREDLAERLINEGRLDRKSAYYAADQVLLWAERIASGEVRPPASEIEPAEIPEWRAGREKMVGFIGLGIMGSRMAANLQAAGHEMIVYNRHLSKADPLVEAGATAMGSPADVARQADVLFTMLSTPEAVEEVALGQEGFLDQMSLGSLWVDCSTVNPSFARRMANEAGRRGVRYVDAPVAGTKGPAEQGELIFFAGGSNENVDACRPYLDVMGKSIHHVGGTGMGVSMKMLFNLLLGQSMLAFSEALVLGEALGLESERLLDSLVGSTVVAPFVSYKRAKIESDQYEADFPLKWMRKDLELAAQTAYEQDTPLPGANLAKEIYALAAQKGLAEDDFAAIYRFLSEKTGEG